MISPPSESVQHYLLPVFSDLHCGGIYAGIPVRFTTYHLLPIYGLLVIYFLYLLLLNAACYDLCPKHMIRFRHDVYGHSTSHTANPSVLRPSERKTVEMIRAEKGFSSLGNRRLDFWWIRI